MFTFLPALDSDKKKAHPWQRKGAPRPDLPALAAQTEQPNGPLASPTSGGSANGQGAGSNGGGTVARLWRTIRIPNVINLATAYFGVKLVRGRGAARSTAQAPRADLCTREKVRYTLLFWLPYFLHIRLGWSTQMAGWFLSARPCPWRPLTPAGVQG